MRFLAFLPLFFFAGSVAICAPAEPEISGVWYATVGVADQEIPFRIEFAGRGTQFQARFFNGDDQVTSTAGALRGDALSASFAHYGTKLEAALRGGRLEGGYGRAGRAPYPFRAVRQAPARSQTGSVPDIDGPWEIAVQSPKGESAWRLLVKQQASEVNATILRVDGDTGVLNGGYRDGRFVLSHFSGARPAVLTLTPGREGDLVVELSGRGKFTALRPAAARAKGLAGPTDPSAHTSVKNPGEAFRFRFQDLSGRERAETDPRFQGKVLIVNVTGSWCPNCHDEAPFLVELYRRYRAQGLEIVAISFEEAEQLQDPARLRAFIQQYGIEYTVLLGGEPAELQAKLPQSVNLNSWPTTFFVGRDGRVRAIHAGFASRASGELHEEAKRHFRTNVESLLAEPPGPTPQ